MADDQQQDAQDGIGETQPVEMAEEGYPPDAEDVDEGPGTNVPQPRARQVRGAMQRNPMKAKTQKRLAKGSNRILSQQKRRQAIELRKAGATYQAIADAVGYNDASAARKAVQKAYGEIIQEPVAELKMLQIERLNHMLMVLWPKVQQGDLGAMNTSLSIMNKIDALEGTEAAREIKVQNDTAVLIVDGNKEDYIKALQKMSGAGVMPDGTNMTAQQVQALPAGPTGSPQTPATRYPPGMGGTDTSTMTLDPETDEEDGEVVDAVLVEDGPPKMSDCPSPLGTVCKDPTCQLHYPGGSGQGMPTKKKFSFGVDPTVKREPKG